MATRHQQQQIRKGNIIGQSHRQGVTFKVINRQKRFLSGKGNRLGSHGANHHPTNQARSTGTGNRIKIVEINTGIIHRLGRQPIKMFEMRTRGNLGHHTTIRTMVIKLGQNAVGQNFALVIYDSSGRFITAGFDTKYDHNFDPVRGAPTPSAWENNNKGRNNATPDDDVAETLSAFHPRQAHLPYAVIAFYTSFRISTALVPFNTQTDIRQ